jgi:hypothetical protein
MALERVKEMLEIWRNDSNEYRPHNALTYLSPTEFARKHAAYRPYSTSVFLVAIRPLFGEHPRPHFSNRNCITFVNTHARG